MARIWSAEKQRERNAEPVRDVGRRGGMSKRSVPFLALMVVPLLATACAGGSPGSSAAASDSPASASIDPTTSGIEHPSGATDVVLRVSTGGGFMIAGFAATEAPTFTLYGDGTVVFRDPAEALPPPPANSSLMPGLPFKTARLSEPQVQALLQSALGDGGLGIARPKYDAPGYADASTTTFEVHAGGVDKTVEVYALSPDPDPSLPDLVARKAFAQLAERLAKFDQGGTLSAQPYVPAAYRGVLFELPGVVVPDVRQWPWATIKPQDFTVSADPNLASFPKRTMTPDELAPLALPDVSGGAQGIYIQGPGDGKLYSFALRPLLPGDSE